MDEFKKFLKKVATISAGVFAFTSLSALDLGFYIFGNPVSFQNEPFQFLLVLLLFSIIPLVLVMASSALYVGCNSSNSTWLSRKAQEFAEGYESSRKEAEEYNS
jgi:hypothetical protein